MPSASFRPIVAVKLRRKVELEALDTAAHRVALESLPKVQATIDYRIEAMRVAAVRWSRFAEAFDDDTNAEYPTTSGKADVAPSMDDEFRARPGNTARFSTLRDDDVKRELFIAENHPRKKDEPFDGPN